MAKLLCITTGLTGILKASCALAKNLTAAGHEVHCSAPFTDGKYIEHQGLTFKPLKSYPLTFDKRVSLSEMPSIWGWDTFEQLLEEEKYDLVIIDQEVHELIICLHQIGQKYVLLSQWFPLWPNEAAPSLKTLWYPGEDERTSKDIKDSWKRLRTHRTMKAWKSNLTLKTTRRSALLCYAQRAGLTQGIIDKYGWPPPYHYAQLPVITMNNPDLDFEGNARQLDHWLGAQIDEDRKEVIPEDKVAEIRTALDALGDKKLILCTLSTMDASDTQHLSKIIQAVEKHPEWELWVTLGKKSNFSTEALPENVKVFGYVPQLEILKKASISINHGGIHTINECIHYQVPMLVYSGGRHDQNGCAARVHFHKVGIRGDKERDTYQDVDLSLSELMNNEIFQQHLKVQYDAYMAHRKVNRAAQVIQEFIEN